MLRVRETSLCALAMSRWPPGRRALTVPRGAIARKEAAIATTDRYAGSSHQLRELESIWAEAKEDHTPKVQKLAGRVLRNELALIETSGRSTGLKIALLSLNEALLSAVQQAMNVEGILSMLRECGSWEFAAEYQAPQRSAPRMSPRADMTHARVMPCLAPRRLSEPFRKPGSRRGGSRRLIKIVPGSGRHVLLAQIDTSPLREVVERPR